jgi:hypothetical protein
VLAVPNGASGASEEEKRHVEKLKDDEKYLQQFGKESQSLKTKQPALPPVGKQPTGKSRFKSKKSSRPLSKYI